MGPQAAGTQEIRGPSTSGTSYQDQHTTLGEAPFRRMCPCGTKTLEYVHLCETSSKCYQTFALPLPPACLLCYRGSNTAGTSGLPLGDFCVRLCLLKTMPKGTSLEPINLSPHLTRVEKELRHKPPAPVNGYLSTAGRCTKDILFAEVSAD